MAVEIALELLPDYWIQRPNKTHIMVVPQLMKLSWRKQICKAAGLLFTVTSVLPFWGSSVIGQFLKRR